ncbi:MAG: MerR family transcriptional regulator [Spirochaetia bacterium]|nr:MerR family transcriptional regulator [Spirochaetia bacterium]
MTGYQIGTVCELLEVKPHVLRYWEQELPILSPQGPSRPACIFTAGAGFITTD